MRSTGLPVYCLLVVRCTATLPRRRKVKSPPRWSVDHGGGVTEWWMHMSRAYKYCATRRENRRENIGGTTTCIPLLGANDCRGLALPRVSGRGQNRRNSTTFACCWRSSNGPSLSSTTTSVSTWRQWNIENDSNDEDRVWEASWETERSTHRVSNIRTF